MRTGKILADGSIVREQAVGARAREMLQRWGGGLESLGPDECDESDLRHFNEARLHLDQLFLLVLAGEFNAGTSASSTISSPTECSLRPTWPVAPDEYGTSDRNPRTRSG